MNYRTLFTASVVTILTCAPLATSAAIRVTTLHPAVLGKEGPFASSTAAVHAGIAPTAARTVVQNTIMAKAHDRADQEIDRRVTALGALAARIGTIHISDADKSSLQATMRGQIDDLDALKSRIAGDASTTTLKSAVQSITKSYRIYALVIPQAAITAAADRVNQVVSQMQALAVKLGTRVSAAQAAGQDVTALTTALNDLNAKVTDAINQAQAAVTETNTLTPDNGNATAQKANQAALKDANAKIKAAEKDLQAARKDAAVIVKGLGGSGATASTTPAQ